MTPNERSARASIFRGALEDGVLVDTLAMIEDQFIEEWKRAQSSHERENCWQAVRVLQLLTQHMAAIANGERDGLAAIRRLK